ncbi:MAG: hydrogenase maturation nickel metallochaperone HypA [Candidatus Delongbacteria bacterium]
MHELAVAAEVLELAQRVLDREGARHVRVIRLRVGVASCLAPDSLAFGFEALAAGTAAAGCRLEFQRPPAPVRCPACGWNGELESLDELACAICGQGPLTLLGGRDLRVVSMDVE